MKRGKFYRRDGIDLNLFSNIRNLEEKIKKSYIKRNYFSNDSFYKEYLIKSRVIKIIYGIGNRQFLNYLKKINKKTSSVDINLILPILERRLDNFVYRSGFSLTRRSSRQYINHKNILVNKKVVDIPSYLLKKNDTIKIKKKNKNILLSIKTNKFKFEWIEVNKINLTSKLIKIPKFIDLSIFFNKF